MYDRLMSRIPEGDSPFTGYWSVIFYSTLLTAGLLFVTPGGTYTVEKIGIDFPLPELIFVGAVLQGYFALALYYREFHVPIAVALLVTATMSANVPLASEQYIDSFVGNVGPHIWLFQPLLILGFTALFIDGNTELNKPAALLFGLPIWMLVSLPFVGTPRTDAVLFYAVFFLQGVATLFLFSELVRKGVLSVRGFLGGLSVPVVGHSLYALLQFLNQNPFGYTFLGEAAIENANLQIGWITVPVLGRLYTGEIVSGLTGNASTLAGLIVIVLPFLVSSLDLRKRSVPVVLGLLVTTVVLRVSENDAARGAVFVSIMVLLILWLARHSRGLSVIKAKFDVSLSPIVGSLAIILTPSNKMVDNTESAEETTGSDSADPYTNTSTPTETSPDTATPTETSPDTATPTETSPDTATPTETSPDTATPTETSPDTATPTETSPDTATEVSTASSKTTPSGDLSVVDLSTLGTRFQQYLAGIDIFTGNPLFGSGAVGFFYLSTSYGLDRKIALHNVYLSVLVEMGVVGFALFALAFGLILLYSAALVYETSDRAVQAAVAGLIGVLAIGVFHIFPMLRYQFFVPWLALSGALVGRYQASGANVWKSLREPV